LPEKSRKLKIRTKNTYTNSENPIIYEYSLVFIEKNVLNQTSEKNLSFFQNDVAFNPNKRPLKRDN